MEVFGREKKRTKFYRHDKKDFTVALEFLNKIRTFFLCNLINVIRKGLFLITIIMFRDDI